MNNDVCLRPCPFCLESMSLIKIIASLPALPEIRVFYCAPCKHPETEVIREAA